LNTWIERIEELHSTAFNCIQLHQLHQAASSALLPARLILIESLKRCVAAELARPFHPWLPPYTYMNEACRIRLAMSLASRLRSRLEIPCRSKSPVCDLYLPALATIIPIPQGPGCRLPETMLHFGRVSSRAFRVTYITIMADSGLCFNLHPVDP
jgi:hypothetical protein